MASPTKDEWLGRIPDDIGRYKVGSQIGRGAQAGIYQARDQDGEKVAVKQFVYDEQGDKVKNDIFPIVSRLNHENVVRYLDAVTHTDGSVWLFIEYCEFRDLQSYFISVTKPEREEHKYPLTPQRMLHIMRDVATGLEYLHDEKRNYVRNIAHRDVKPDNIFIARHPERPEHEVIAKLADLDFCKILDPSGSRSSASSITGAPCFMAPEFYARKHSLHELMKKNDKGIWEVHYGRSVDVFSTGLTFLSMIQGLDDHKVLRPRPSGVLKDNEVGVDGIGEIIAWRMHKKKTDPSIRSLDVVDLTSDSDTTFIHRIKELIRDMTLVEIRPLAKQRPTATEVVARLEKIEREVFPPSARGPPSARVDEVNVEIANGARMGESRVETPMEVTEYETSPKVYQENLYMIPDDPLTSRDLALLGSINCISTQNMESIALIYMDIEPAKIESMKTQHRENPGAFNRDILRIWKNKNPGPGQRQALARLLFQAGEEGYVDPDKIQSILGVQRQSDFRDARRQIQLADVWATSQTNQEPLEEQLIQTKTEASDPDTSQRFPAVKPQESPEHRASPGSEQSRPLQSNPRNSFKVTLEAKTKDLPMAFEIRKDGSSRTQGIAWQVPSGSTHPSRPAHGGARPKVKASHAEQPLQKHDRYQYSVQQQPRGNSRTPHSDRPVPTAQQVAQPDSRAMKLTQEFAYSEEFPAEASAKLNDPNLQEVEPIARLTERHLLEISKHVTNAQQVRELGAHLGVDAESFLSGAPRETQLAALRLLFKWFENQTAWDRGHAELNRVLEGLEWRQVQYKVFENPVYEIPIPEPRVDEELTSQQLSVVAKRISSQYDLYKFAISLGLPYHQIATALTDHPGITNATLKLLQQWKDSQPDLRAAFRRLIKVLLHCNKGSLVVALGEHTRYPLNVDPGTNLVS